jgi:hypothetical protein
MRVIAVIAAFREVPRVQAAVKACFPYVERVIVVDDGSRDGTAEEALAGGALVLRHTINRGQGAALKTGTLAALELGAEAIVHLDADGQHDPSFIPALIQPLQQQEADIVFGSRFLGMKAIDMPLMRSVLMRGIKLFNIFALGIPSTVRDPQTGMRAFTAAAVPMLDFQQDGMAHCSEILRLATKNLRWKEVPVVVRYTKDSLEKGQWRGGVVQIVWQLLVGSFRK